MASATANGSGLQIDAQHTSQCAFVRGHNRMRPLLLPFVGETEAEGQHAMAESDG
jgi:hypothetical protein